MKQKTRHLLGLSGGKDSSALAVYMRDRVPEMEYFFSDTGKELPETYAYLDLLEAFLGKPIVRLNMDTDDSKNRDFDHWLTLYGGLLPSSQVRWCTVNLKIKPFEEYVGEDRAYHYIAIRADEDRVGYKPPTTSSLRNIEPKYPFKEDGITKEDVYRILEESGLGLPDYYQWRTRSGCYFCFFQRKSEWVGLLEQHPELFELAKEYEKFNSETGERFTWGQGESLEELSDPERIKQIKANTEKAMASKKTAKPNRSLVEILTDVFDDEDDEEPCLICHK
ncbi:MAG: phosphoadenosine phosphosulfate reductase family protein [Gammaproteobacteria bacterium]|nr:phosphoadenosine phosphosulfate reductase family protein [Candidatus Poribacteria bacterium]MYC24435.1 phosphoadenosine phosphosulfate reductase family protein [Gammaproteobacteria bacterium]